MSLICGILSPMRPELASAEALHAIMAPSSHRLQDRQRTFVDAQSGLALGYGHTATFGHPPGSPAWVEDDDHVAGVDGSIFDREKHLGKSREPSTNPHATAVGECYRADERSFPAGLDGNYALFLWDRRRRRLLISGDPMGHKLLYYSLSADSSLLVFSSELKGVLAHPAVAREIDPGVVPLYLRLGHTPAPFTMARGVAKLRAAECLVSERGESSVRRFWRPSPETGPQDLAHWVSRARSEILDSTRRLTADVDRVGVFLSGGVDSSVTLAAVKEVGATQAAALTLEFAGHKSSYDAEWAGRIAGRLGVKQRTVSVDPEVDITPELMARLMRQIDEPFESATRVVNEYFLGRAALEEGLPSVLNGANPHIAMERIRSVMQEGPLPESLDDALRAVLSGPPVFSETQISRALAFPPDMEVIDRAALANREIVQDLERLPALSLGQRLLMATNRTGLFFQLIPPLLGFEERTPFLDTHFSSLVISVPPQHRGLEDPATNRAILRACFREELQTDFRDREKRGFPRMPLPGWLEQMTIPGIIPLVRDGIMRQDYLASLEQRCAAGRTRVKKEAWQWFVLACWYQFQINQVDPFASAYAENRAR